MLGRDVLVVLLLILVGETHAGLWITLPSAQDGCGSFQENSYFWDTDTFEELKTDYKTRGFSIGGGFGSKTLYIDRTKVLATYDSLDYAQLSLIVPNGNYDAYYYPSPPSIIYFSDVQQYFCTGYVESMPVGSYCFYQNIQNCNYLSFSFLFSFFQ